MDSCCKTMYFPSHTVEETEAQRDEVTSKVIKPVNVSLKSVNWPSLPITHSVVILNEMAY